jgi:hypothetical protein
MKIGLLLVCVALALLGGCATRKNDRCNPVWLGEAQDKTVGVPESAAGRITEISSRTAALG